jgi:hypothetical protein
MEHLRAYLRIDGFTPSLVLIGAWYVTLHLLRGRMWILALLALPGTIAHELSHFVVGLLAGAQPAGFRLWPKRMGDHWMLGSVSFRNLGLFNGALVSLAPLLLLPPAWLCLLYVAPHFWVTGQWALWILAGYLAATFCFAATPSRQDLKIGASSLLLYLAVGAFLWWLISAWRA